MKNTFTRVISLLLCLLLMFSVAGCREPVKEPVGSNGSVAESSVPAEESELPSDIAEVESIPEIDIDLNIDTDINVDDPVINEGYEITVDRPEVYGSLISTGIKLAYATDEEEIDIDIPEIEDVIGDDFEIDVDLDENEYDYQALIQKVGEKVSGKKREITIDNSKDGIVFTNFTGISCNVFPTQSTLFSQTVHKTAEAYLDMNGKRFNDVASRFARSWFQVDWLVTHKAGNDYKKYVDDWSDNPDYNNYMKGVYCFSDGQEISDELYSAIQYYQMLEQAATEIYLAFGWKVGTRVQHWFSNTPNRQELGAPRDVKAYAKAAAALFKYMRNEVGLTNFNTLSFYNEPDTTESFTYQNSWDYVTIGDKCSYWAAMARAAQVEFDKHDDLKDVLIMGPDSSRKLNAVSDEYVNIWVAKYAPDCVDAYTLHFYGYKNDDADEIYYEDFFDACVFVHNFYTGKPVYITEYFVNGKDITDKNYAWQDDIGWGGSLASLYIAMANTGINGGFKWAMVGGALIEPTSFFCGETESSSWYHPRDIESINKVTLSFYEESLLNQYVLKDSNVHDIQWTGDDIRCAAFTTKNGSDLSLVVEANEKSDDKTLNINLKESLGGRDVYLYWFNHDWEKDGNALIPQCQDVITNVKDSISYNINGKYGIYVFTTIPPVKQVALFDKDGEPAAGVNCRMGGKVTVSHQLIDCEAGDKVKWELTAYNAAPLKDTNGNELKREDCLKTGTYAERGELIDNGDGTITYKATSKAKKGDIIAIRCTIVDGDKNTRNDRYAVCNIIVK